MLTKAIEKINAEMQKAPNDKYIEAIGQYIIDRCSEESAAEKVLEAGKTLARCLDSVKTKARGKAKNGCAVMTDSEVFCLVCEYFGFGEKRSAESTKPAKVNVDLNDFFKGV